MEKTTFNKCQTPLEELHLEEYPKEVQENFFEAINTIPFVKWMISPDRPLISELPKDESGKAIIDTTKPPILEHTEFFRQTALAYEQTGQYTLLKPNRNPQSDFQKWFQEEKCRGWNGLVDPSTGMWIPGDYYWMLNYCPMHRVVKAESGLEMRSVRHPNFWDGQLFVSWYVNQSRFNGHHSAYLSSRGRGKAHPYSQLVYTPEGIKQWGDIQIGDVLFGDDGKLTKVTDIPFNEEEEIYLVTLSDGRTLQCTSGHLFYVKDSREPSSMQVIDLWQIMHSDYAYKKANGEIKYNFSIPNNKKVEFNAQRVLLDPYTLGLLLGNSDFTKSSSTVTILTSPEKDLECYKQYVPYEVFSFKTKGSYGIAIDNLKEILKKYDLWRVASEAKFIPKEFLFNTSEVRLNILKGLLDANGTIRKDDGIPTLSTSSKRLAKDVVWLCHSLGYNAEMRLRLGRYKDKSGRTHRGRNCYIVTIFTNEEVFRLPRKLERLVTFPTAYTGSEKDWTKIIDIKYSHREKAKCVIVDNESHCYLIDEFIVTHNTSSGAGMLSRRFTIGESAENNKEVQCMVTASDRTKLAGTNQILDVFVDYIDHIAKTTHFPARRLKSSFQELIWESGYKLKGSEVAHGSQNSVSGIISGVNQDKLNGSRGVLYLIEEAGIFKDLVEMYNMIRPSVEEGSSVFGQILLYGTSGNEQSDFRAFAEMFYHPQGFNLQGMPNIFDKEGQGSPECCMFYPVYLNYDGSCIDENGNSDVTKALLKVYNDRYKVKYGTSDVNVLTKRISQYPVTPQEAIIKSHSNVFPVTELNERLNQIDNNPSEYDDIYVGELLLNNGGEVKFQTTGDLPIREYPLNNNKAVGAIEIFEMPQKGADGKVPYDRYISSLDPFDADVADTMSLGSCFVMDLWTDTIVAEYTGRPTFAEDLFEIVRRLCIFYNCKCLYERNLKGCFSYFSARNSLHLLADTPQYLLDRQIISSIGYGNTSKGVHATAPIIKFGFRLINDWLRKPVTSIEKTEDGTEEEVTISNLYKLRNRALIKELIQWNPYKNFDRVLSLVELMLYREEKIMLYQGSTSMGRSAARVEEDDYWKANYPGLAE